MEIYLLLRPTSPIFFYGDLFNLGLVESVSYLLTLLFSFLGFQSIFSNINYSCNQVSKDHGISDSLIKEVRDMTR
ncbi:hypothetical protein MKX01_023387, partial [Papaver californicum]